MISIARLCTSWTPLLVLPSGEAVAVDSWPAQDEARMWGESVQAQGWARLHDVVPLIQASDFLRIASAGQQGGGR